MKGGYGKGISPIVFRYGDTSVGSILPYVMALIFPRDTSHNAFLDIMTRNNFMKRVFVILILLLIGGSLATGCTSDTKNDGTSNSPEPTLSATVSPMPHSSDGVKVRLQTTMGNITLRLYPDMSITAGNFERLVGEGFYDKTIFHRVIDTFMIQGGDPTGTGTGGPGYTIQDEFVSSHLNTRGTIAMANTGRPNSSGSQFFINLVDNHYLDGKHPVFGEVIEGLEVVDLIGEVPTDANDRPLQNVTILRAIVL